MDVISYSKIKKVKAELDEHKEEYGLQRQQDQLKVLNVEKELKDYQKTLAQVNVNHEAKQSASGYGTISLPPNAANGQISVSVKGETRTNILGNIGDFEDLTKWTLHTAAEGGTSKLSQDKRLFGYNSLQFNNTGGNLHRYMDITGLNNVKYYELSVYCNVESAEGNTYFSLGNFDYNGFLNPEYSRADITKLNQWQRLKLKFTGKDSIRVSVGNGSDATGIAYFDGMMLREISQEEYNDSNNITPNYVRNTKSTISAMRITAENEDKTEKSQAYVIAKDKDNKIVNLRSLPNGTKDEIRVSEGKAIIKTKEYTIKDTDVLLVNTYEKTYVVKIAKPTGCIDFIDNVQGCVLIPNKVEKRSVTLTNITDDYIGNFATDVSQNIFFYFPPNSTLEYAKQQLVGTKLIYQLAEPEIIPIEVSGNIIAHPNGTVYVEHGTFTTGVYGTNGVTVTNTGLPIKTINKITKIDYTTGLEYDLDVSTATISEDKLLFTHPDLITNDIVFFDYDYDLESTEGLATVEFYDSRYVIEDKSVAGKFYTWKVEVDNGVPSITVVEV